MFEESLIEGRGSYGIQSDGLDGWWSQPIRPQKIACSDVACENQKLLRPSGKCNPATSWFIASLLRVLVFMERTLRLPYLINSAC